MLRVPEIHPAALNTSGLYPLRRQDQEACVADRKAAGTRRAGQRGGVGFSQLPGVTARTRAGGTQRASGPSDEAAEPGMKALGDAGDLGFIQHTAVVVFRLSARKALFRASRCKLVNHRLRCGSRAHQKKGFCKLAL